MGGNIYLRECPVIPKIAFMGKAVTDKTKFVLFNVLLDWIQVLFLGDLVAFPLASRTIIDLLRVAGELIGTWRAESKLLCTSSLPLVHRGISTIMFSIVCCSLA